MYRDGFLKVDVVLIFKCLLQLRVQSRRFDRVTEGVVNIKAVCCVSASFGVCAYTNDYHYDIED